MHITRQSSLLLGVAILGFVTSATAAEPASTTKKVVLVELFTSQG